VPVEQRGLNRSLEVDRMLGGWLDDAVVYQPDALIALTPGHSNDRSAVSTD
jgi:hypothetical protein